MEKSDRFYSRTIEESKENSMFLFELEKNKSTLGGAQKIKFVSCWVERNGIYKAGIIKNIEFREGYRINLCLMENVQFSDLLECNLIDKNKSIHSSALMISGRENCPIFYFDNIVDSFQLIIKKNSIIIDSISLIKKL